MVLAMGNDIDKEDIDNNNVNNANIDNNNGNNRNSNSRGWKFVWKKKDHMSWQNGIFIEWQLFKNQTCDFLLQFIQTM
jgi:hypothetical protein